jgi:hypothetical protein
MINATTDTVIAIHTRARPRPSPLSVYDGRRLVGHLVHQGDSFQAFDINGADCGTFADMKSAAVAIPARNAP